MRFVLVVGIMSFCFLSSAAEGSTSSRRFVTSRAIASPSFIAAIGPPSAASGARRWPR
jgi:hypothetical protein